MDKKGFKILVVDDEADVGIVYNDGHAGHDWDHGRAGTLS